MTDSRAYGDLNDRAAQRACYRKEFRREIIMTAISWPLVFIACEALLGHDWDAVASATFWVWATLAFVWFGIVRRAFPVTHDVPTDNTSDIGTK